MKKIICLFLSLVLLFTGIAFALAEDVSKSSNSGSTSHSSNDSGWKRPKTQTEEPSVEVIVTDASDAAKDQIAAMAAAAAAGDSPLSILPEDIQAQLAALGDDVTANEACGIDVANFNDGCGAIDTEFSFATVYDQSKKVFALVTCFDANKTVTDQFVLPVTITPEGKVKIHFTEDVLKAIDKAASSSIVLFEKR